MRRLSVLNEIRLGENPVRAAAPGLVFVALGVPKQKIWVRNNAAKLGIQARSALAPGIDFIAGKQHRAPWPFAAGVRMALAGTLRASPAWHRPRDRVVLAPHLSS